MKNLLLPFIITFLIALPVNSWCSPKICFISLSRIIATSQAGKDARTEMENYTRKKKSEITMKENRIRAYQDQMKSTSLTKSQLDSLRNDLIKIRVEYSTLKERYNDDLKDKDKELTMMIAKKVENIVSSIAKEEGIEYVFDRIESAAVFFPKGSDITGMVIKRYDTLYRSDKRKTGKK